MTTSPIAPLGMSCENYCSVYATGLSTSCVIVAVGLGCATTIVTKNPGPCWKGFLGGLACVAIRERAKQDCLAKCRGLRAIRETATPPVEIFPDPNPKLGPSLW